MLLAFIAIRHGKALADGEILTLSKVTRKSESFLVSHPVHLVHWQQKDSKSG